MDLAGSEPQTLKLFNDSEFSKGKRSGKDKKKKMISRGRKLIEM